MKVELILLTHVFFDGGTSREVRHNHVVDETARLLWVGTNLAHRVAVGDTGNQGLKMIQECTRELRDNQ